MLSNTKKRRAGFATAIRKRVVTCFIALRQLLNLQSRQIEQTTEAFATAGVVYTNENGIVTGKRIAWNGDCTLIEINLIGLPLTEGDTGGRTIGTCNTNVVMTSND